jgi:hypothetical protein
VLVSLHAGLASAPSAVIVPPWCRVAQAPPRVGRPSRWRPVLGGRHACQIFARRARRATLKPGKRKEIVHGLTLVAAELLDGEPAPTPHHIRRAW